mmetsp:Transcript_77253/g.151544  ORF Transcript_77253/g.151544 Transcript_77253/m.151544 type:complete len:297 (-) Transcript_77253:26-916(-)
MSAEIPPSFKIVTSAIRRAEELQRDSNRDAQLVGYYCRYYAVSKASKLCSVPAVAAETKFLIDEMGKLEKFKADFEPFSQETGMNTCKSYAMSVFQKADDEDRAGAADKGTAKLFYAAGTFFDIMEQFGELPNEISEKRKYSKWKATEIINAIKNGDRPVPGGFGESMGEMRISDSDSNSVNQIPPAPRADSSMAPPSAQSSPSPTTPSTPAPAPFKAYVPQPSAPPVQPVVASSSNMNHYYAQSPPPTFTRPPVANNDPRVQDTVELCNFAILALKKNEIALAKDRLREALRRLE